MHSVPDIIYMNLHDGKELEVLRDSESVKEHIVLGANAEAPTDLVHVAPDVVTIDDCRASRGCVQT